MVTYLVLVRKAISKLTGLSITQVPREANAVSDRLARLASSSELDLPGIRVEYLSKTSVSNPDGIEVNSIDIGPS